MRKLALLTVFAALVALTFTLPALARGRGGGKGGGPHPARIEACEGLSEGEACTFNSPRGKRSGTCQPARNGDVLVCRGKGNGRGRR